MEDIAENVVDVVDAADAEQTSALMKVIYSMGSFLYSCLLYAGGFVALSVGMVYFR